RDALLADFNSTAYTDVFLFSHGWNNDWETASKRYDAFIDGYVGLRKKHALATSPGYKPLLVGIIWPSTALVLPWEEAPHFAALPPARAQDAQVAAEREDVREIA